LLLGSGLTKIYGKSTLAVDGVHLALKPGEVLALFGPDGAGKTTLLQMLAGVIKPTAGVVTIYGEDIRTARRLCGYVAQQFNLSQDLSVKENMRYAADLHALPRTHFAKQCDRLLSMVGLERFEDRMTAKLSGGMKEKLAIACAMVFDPKLLILDEPTTGIDPLGRREIHHTLVELARLGTSVILGTSDLDEVEIADRIALMDHGRLDESTIAALLQDREQALARKRDARTKISTSVHKLDPSMKKSGEFTIPPQVIQAVSQQPQAPRPLFVDQPVPCIDVTGVVKRFGAFAAVDGVTFSITRGEIFGLLGANGAGKSTTIQMLCGLQKPTSGAVRILGEDPRGAAARKIRARMGYMNQRFSLYDGLTVAENIDFYAWSYGIPASVRKTRVGDALAKLELGDIRNEPVARLPRGWKQRVAFAAATLHSPDVLFLDEPTAGTDSKTRQMLWSLINEFAAAGATVLVTTHFLDEAEFCDRLVLMVAGRLVAQGSPEQVRQNCDQGAVEFAAEEPQEVSHILGEHFEAWRVGLHQDSVRVLSSYPAADLQLIQRQLQAREVEFANLRTDVCTLEEAFIAAISKTRAQAQ